MCCMEYSVEDLGGNVPNHRPSFITFFNSGQNKQPGALSHVVTGDLAPDGFYHSMFLFATGDQVARQRRSFQGLTRFAQPPLWGPFCLSCPPVKPLRHWGKCPSQMPPGPCLHTTTADDVCTRLSVPFSFLTLITHMEFYTRAGTQREYIHVVLLSPRLIGICPNWNLLSQTLTCANTPWALACLLSGRV